jgi:short-subunit dehydrogenase
MDISGRLIVVTGASRGIGEATTRSLIGAGARVVAVARDAEALGRLAGDTGAIARPADLLDPDALAGLIAGIEADVGPIDVLVNNAGMEATEAFWNATADGVARVVALNLLAPIELTRQVIGPMRARDSGWIVNVSSLAGCVALPGFTTYGATKAGLTHFTAGLARDLVGSNIGTTCVEIGPVVTELLAGVKSYPPTDRAYRRLYRTGLFCDISLETVGDAIRDAIRRERAHVRLPRRSALSAQIAQVPRTITNLLTAGIRNPVE